MASARYFDLVREMKDAYNYRLRLVESAKQRGPSGLVARSLAITKLRKLRRPRPHWLSYAKLFPPSVRPV